MSIKTLRKRIALVAVSALGAGFMSVVAVPSANAAVGTVSYDSASTGIITSSLATIDTTTETATMSVSGQLVLDVTSGTQTTILVSGGTIQGYDALSAGTATINPAGTCIINNAGAFTNLKFKPNAAGTNMVISFIADYDCATATAANPKITVTVVPAGASGTFSLANSLISLDSDTDTSAAASDTPGAGFVSYYSTTGVANINYTLNDALGNAMPASTIVTATVTKGSCLVDTDVPFKLGAAPSDTFVVESVDYSETCDVTIAVDGVVAVTKSIKFSGPVAKVVVHTVTTANSGTAGNQTAKGYFHVLDAAGNKLGNVTVGVDTTKYGNIVSAITLANSNKTSTTDSSINKGSNPGAVDASFGVTCTGVKGTQKGMRLKYTSSAGVVTYSDPFDVSCYGGLFSYSAALDAASYTTGGIATLTVSAKDSAGNPVADGVTVTGGVNTTNTTVTCGGQATIVNPVTIADSFLGGKATYKFTLGTTEGNYNCIVTLGDYTVANTGNTALAPATAAWSLKSATTSVSNAEVLAAIVKLIASINKQIRALQKSLRR